VSTAGWHPELFVVFRRQGHAIPLSAACRVGAAIDDHIKDFTRGHPDELALRLGRLEMQPAQDPARGPTVIILNKWLINARFAIAIGVPSLKKKSTSITVDGRAQ
jgi:hypothetical protein